MSWMSPSGRTRPSSLKWWVRGHVRTHMGSNTWTLYFIVQSFTALCGPERWVTYLWPPRCSTRPPLIHSFTPWGGDRRSPCETGSAGQRRALGGVGGRGASLTTGQGIWVITPFRETLKFAHSLQWAYLMIDNAGFSLWTKILELIAVICQSTRMCFDTSAYLWLQVN